MYIPFPYLQGLHNNPGLCTFKQKFVHTLCTFKQKFVPTLCTFKAYLKLKPPMFPPGRSVTQNLQNYYWSDFKICLLAKETALDFLVVSKWKYLANYVHWMIYFHGHPLWWKLLWTQRIKPISFRRQFESWCRTWPILHQH